MKYVDTILQQCAIGCARILLSKPGGENGRSDRSGSLVRARREVRPEVGRTVFGNGALGGMTVSDEALPTSGTT